MEDNKKVIPKSYKQRIDVFVVSNSSTGIKGPNESNQDSSHLIDKMICSIKHQFGSTKIVVHFLICVFAIASWADLNGMWSELPLLVMKVKEGWSLPSYIIIISQVANIGPLSFVVVSFLWPQLKPRLEKITSYVIILISAAASFLMAFFWDKSSYIGGTEHSIALLTLNFFLAIGDCTSSVSFYAFMSHLKPEYMASLFIGEGLSGMLPALIALGQGAGDIVCINSSSFVNETFPNGSSYNKTVYNVYPQYVEPYFTVQVYFFILSGIILLSAIAFHLLNFWGYCKSEIIAPPEKDQASLINQKKGPAYGSMENGGFIEEAKQDHLKSENGFYSNGGGAVDRNNYLASGQHRGNEQFSHISSGQDQYLKSGTTNGDLERSISGSVTCSDHHTQPKISVYKYFTLLAVIVIINMTLTAFMASIQIYTVLPYGLVYYHLTTTLTQIANPVACFFALFIMAESLVTIVVLTILGEMAVGYLIYVASTSPEPPLHGTSSGGDLALALWVILTLFLIYAKVCCASILRKQGRNALIWAGSATQVGALIGAIVGFVLVNEYTFFKDAPFC